MEASIDKSALRGQASENIRAALADPNASRAVAGETLGLLEGAVGREKAWELEGDRMSAVSDLLSTRDELSRTMESASRDMEQAETYIRGGSALFNCSTRFLQIGFRMEILQGRGPGIDRLCGIFYVQVDIAVKAEYAILRTLAERTDA